MLQTIRTLKHSLTSVSVDYIEKVLNTEDSSEEYQRLFVSFGNLLMQHLSSQTNHRTPKRESLLSLQTLNMQGRSSVW